MDTPPPPPHTHTHLCKHLLIVLVKTAIHEGLGNLTGPVGLAPRYHHLTRPLQHPLRTRNLGSGEGEGQQRKRNEEAVRGIEKMRNGEKAQTEREKRLVYTVMETKYQMLMLHLQIVINHIQF